jgi:hypothetical membrane protein
VKAWKDSLTDWLLRIAVLVPFLYFGAQLIAAPFFPNYSFLRQVASELGSSTAPYPWILNTGLFMVGVATLVGGIGFFLGLRRHGVSRTLCWLVAILMTLSAVGTLKAGIYPLPDPRHASGGFLGVALLIVPILLTISIWKDRNARGIRTYLLLSLAVVACCVPIVSGAVRIDMQGYGGLVQRVFAASVFPPLAVVAIYLLRAKAERMGATGSVRHQP